MENPNSSSQIRRCPSCNAVNMLSRRACDLCGARLLSAADSAESDQQREIDPPSGWQAEALSDGTVRLRRDSSGRLNRHLEPWMYACFLIWPVAIFLVKFLGIIPPDNYLPFAIGTLAGGLGITALLAILWITMGHEEFHIASPHIVWRMFFFQKIQEKVLRGPGVLRIETRIVIPRHDGHRGLPYIVSALHLDAIGASQVMDVRKRAHNPLSTREYTERPENDAEVEQLARYLAARTGWPIENS